MSLTESSRAAAEQIIAEHGYASSHERTVLLLAIAWLGGYGEGASTVKDLTDLAFRGLIGELNSHDHSRGHSVKA